MSDSPRPSAWRRGAAAVVRPDPAITDRDEVRRAVLLQVLSLALAMTLSLSGAISVVTTVLFPDPTVSLGWVGTAIILVTAGGFWHAFLTSRGPRYRLGAWLTVVAIYLFLTAFSLAYPASAQSLVVAYAMPILVGTIFLPLRGTLRLVGVSIVLGVVLLAFSPEGELVKWAYGFAILVVGTALTVIVAVLREGDLAAIRRLRERERAESERLRGEVALARTVQVAMLPAQLPQVPGLELAAFSEPAQEASGDFYDLFAVPVGSDPVLGSVVLVVSDVAGKGVASALVMAATRAAVRSEAEADPSPGRVLARVNDQLAASLPPGLFVTMFVGLLDVATHELRFASGGHPHPHHWRSAHQELGELDSAGLPVGLVPGAEFEERRVRLAPGDFVLAYTDGLVEALDGDGAMYGFDGSRLDVLGSVHAAGGARERVDHVLRRMEAFVGDEPWHDDVTLLALSVPSAPLAGAPDGPTPEAVGRSGG